MSLVALSPMLIFDNQRWLQYLLSLCLPGDLKKTERRKPKPSHKEVSTSLHATWVLRSRNCPPWCSKGGRGDGTWYQVVSTLVQACWMLVPRVLG